MFRILGTVFIVIGLSSVNLLAGESAELVSTADLRSEPSAKSDVLLRLRKGTTVEVVGRRGAWTQVSVKPPKGFAFKAWLPSRSLSSPVRSAQKHLDATVVYTTTESIYFNAGRTQGVESGAAVEIYRAGRMVTNCTVEALADQRSVCKSGGVRVGDVVRVVVTDEATPGGRKTTSSLARPVPEADEDRRLKSVIAATFAKVAFVPGPDVSGRFSSVPLQLGAGHSSWI